MKRIAIIGGGISGLSAAFALEQQRRTGVEVEYVLFEASPRLGGVLLSERVDDCLVEAGPDSFLTEKPWASDLCHELGIDGQLIGSNDQQRKTYILTRGKLEVIPDGLMFMVPTRILPTVLSPMFTLGTKLRMAKEWFHGPRSSGQDETVASFIERHYGPEMVDRMADPLLSGVYGGEASQLSVRAVLPRFAEMEAKHGSLGRAMVSAKKSAKASQAASRPLFTSLKNGMQALVDEVIRALPDALLSPSTAVQFLQQQDRNWVVSAGFKSDVFNAVIVATPAPQAAPLLQGANPELALELRCIPYTSSVTIALGYDKEVRDNLPPGFGFLSPRSEGKRMLAATFVHNKFPHRAPPDRALLRCFVGGSRDEAALQLMDEELVNIVRNELREIIGVTAEPRFTRVYKWPSAMAQYTLGHLDRVEKINMLTQKTPGLFLAGNAYRGIGVPDCVRSGQEAAQQALAAVGVIGVRPEMSA